MIAETLRVYYFLYSQFYLYLFENTSLFIVLFVTHILSFKVWIEVGKWVNLVWKIISYTLYESKLIGHKSHMNFVLCNSLSFLIYTEVCYSLFWLFVLNYSAFLHYINTHCCWLSNICLKNFNMSSKQVSSNTLLQEKLVLNPFDVNDDQMLEKIYMTHYHCVEKYDVGSLHSIASKVIDHSIEIAHSIKVITSLHTLLYISFWM